MLRSAFPFVVAATLALTVGHPAAAATELVANGTFSADHIGSQQMSNGTTQVVTGWTSMNSGSNAGYNFLVTSDPTVNQSIQTIQYGKISLWGTNSTGGTANGLAESVAAHGSFLAADGAFNVSPIYQLINGLTVGQSYTLTFDYAGAQQYGYDGATTEGWYFGLGTDITNLNSFAYGYTGALQDVSHGFTGWKTQTATFTATSSSEYLAFMAQGTPSGEPPFSLLDNVSLKATAAVPEPATWGLMLIGFGLTGALLRRKHRPAGGHEIA